MQQLFAATCRKIAVLPLPIAAGIVLAPLRTTNKVSEIAYDLWTFSRDVLHRWETVNRWTLKGRAQAQYVVPATEGLVDKVRQRKIAHGGDPILEKSIRNARVKNYQGGRRPDKDPSRSMIDPLMAMVYALSSCFEEGGDRVSAYDAGDIGV